MHIRQFFSDDGPLAKAHAAICAHLPGIFSDPRPSQEAPDDFATRPEIPSPEEYEVASNAQILDRLYRNPCGLLNEQPYIDTLMNVRNTENNRKQTRYLAFGFYALALSVVVLAFKTAPPQAQIAEQQRNADKALENAVGLLKEEFNLKLQGKDMEIKDLKRQISLLNQGQADLARQVKSLSKSAAKPPAAAKPRNPN